MMKNTTGNDYNESIEHDSSCGNSQGHKHGHGDNG